MSSISSTATLQRSCNNDERPTPRGNGSIGEIDAARVAPSIDRAEVPTDWLTRLCVLLLLQFRDLPLSLRSSSRPSLSVPFPALPLVCAPPLLSPLQLLLVMVCKDCEKKLTSVIVPDKDRAKSAGAGASSSAAAAASSSKPLMAPGTSKALSLQSNSLIGKKKAVAAAMLASGGKCRLCKSNVHQAGYYWCRDKPALRRLTWRGARDGRFAYPSSRLSAVCAVLCAVLATIARTRRASVRCVARKCWTQNSTNNRRFKRKHGRSRSSSSSSIPATLAAPCSISSCSTSMFFIHVRIRSPPSLF